LLQASLSVDIELLHSLSFKEIRLYLKHGSKRRHITITRQPRDSVYDFVKYKIGRRVYQIPLIPSEQDLRRRFHPRHVKELDTIKEKMTSIVEVSWLSVHRNLIQNEDFERLSRKRVSEHFLNPIDTRLVFLLGALSDYHLALQAQSNSISENFQKKVLSSLLYSDTFDTFDLMTEDEINFGALKADLIHAYQSLGIHSGIKKRINHHVERIQKSIETIRVATEKKEAYYVNDVLPLSLYKRTREIVELSIAADTEKQQLFELLDLFINKINSFLNGKTLSLAPDKDYGLSMKSQLEDIDFHLLSSGEKQLFILFAETVLQNRKQSIFIADEPELSLHVAWQRKLLSAVRELNPSAQLIVATHSPEIAGPWRNNLIKMREVFTQ